ncbi:MAG: hypothetical protein LBR48_04725 [Dysgonamonadaceae bacterium]|jgi:hypothetical protein|nr:hypothetical protein [Dysgonamonadaceae bacterium]
MSEESKDKQIMEYDEDDSVKFIRNHLSEDMQNALSDDEINYIVDLIYEFYEERGFLNEDDDSDVEIDEEEVLSFVLSNARKDGIRNFTEDEIASIVAGEFAYCDSLNIFD